MRNRAHLFHECSWVPGLCENCHDSQITSRDIPDSEKGQTYWLAGWRYSSMLRKWGRLIEIVTIPDYGMNKETGLATTHRPRSKYVGRHGVEGSANQACFTYRTIGFTYTDPKLSRT